MITRNYSSRVSEANPSSYRSSSNSSITVIFDSAICDFSYAFSQFLLQFLARVDRRSSPRPKFRYQIFTFFHDFH